MNKIKRSHSKYYAATTEEFMKLLAEGGFVPIKYKNCNCDGYTEHWINPASDIINLLPSRQRASKTADFVYTYFKYDPDKSKNNAGYHLVNIGFSALLHRVMAYTFLGNPREEQRDINHIDGNKNNNAISNLEWCTHKENMIKYFNKEV